MTNPEIEIKVFNSPLLMQHELVEWLESAASVNNMLLGYLYRLAKKEATGANVPAYLMAAYQNGLPKLAFLQMPTRAEIIMVAEPTDWEMAVDIAADSLRKRGIPLMGTIGPEPQNTAFANAYGTPWHVAFRQNIYQLEELKAPRSAAGKMRLATAQDAELLSGWIVAFFMESLSKVITLEAAGVLINGKIADGTLYVWENEGIVCMAGLERPTRDGVTVVLVYTPTQARTHGYASNLVAGMTAQELGRGRKRLCLHTDANFPTSNKIYVDLGYYPVGSGSILHFD